MIDSKALLADLQRHVRLLEADLAEQLDTLPGLADVLRAEHAAERTARRTAAEWPQWRDAQLTQIAVAWVLGTVFLRWTEDNELIAPVLSGPGDRLAAAEDAQVEHYRRHPEHNDGDWLAEQFDVLRTTDAGRLLFDDEHNPMYWVPISHDAAKVLVAFWRARRADGELRHDFSGDGWDTRFLGDLYQDLSEDAKKRFALLQTPRFIERFILDRTLRPAIEEFGLDGLRLIDPACGSGHFLLGAFERLVAGWQERGLDPYEVARRALDSVHGVDTNPFAVAIARFRLLVAALKVAGVTTLNEAAGQTWRPVVGCTDSLRTPERQESFALVDAAVGHRARWEDIDGFADVALLDSGSYHVVVGNPPYITVKDPEENEYYRKRWSACHRQFQLTVPFAQRIFDLALRAGEDGLGAGYTGQITSNAFMKREFGTKLIEKFFPTVELDYVVDTSGAFIPGHGTPTVILIGRRAVPSRRDAVRAVLGVKGEPSQPDDPEKGLVWSAIDAQVEHAGSESEWVSVVDLPRGRLAQHPWSLSGGGAGDVQVAIEASAAATLVSSGGKVGTGAVTREDDVFMIGAGAIRRKGIGVGSQRPLIEGDVTRDWRVTEIDPAIWPYDPNTLGAVGDPGALRFLWPFRPQLSSRVAFGKSQIEHGKRWFEYSMFFAKRYQMPLSIAFAFVSTHNHFVLDRGGKVFKQSAPVIKLPAGAGEDEHLALLGVMNSSTACFWMKQVCHDKGSQSGTGGFMHDAWEPFYEFTGTKLEQFPLPADLPLSRARSLDALAQQLSATTPDATATTETPTRDRLTAAHAEYDRLRALMISEQEELDWDVYRRYGLLSDAEAADVGAGEAQPLNLGERAFEIVLARRVAAGEAETQWFSRHGSTPITELPAHWPEPYRRTVTARIALIEKRRDLALIERPECKRRWSAEPWEKQQERALRTWLLDRLEARPLWFAHDDNGDEQPVPRSVRALADQVRGDAEFGAVAALWAADALERPDVDLAEVVGALVDAEHVPFLAAYRYKPAGLARRAEWERTWALQREEDAVAARMGHDDVTHPEVRRAVATEVGDVPVPPKYGQSDFLRSTYWSQRGKLDVPKERFVSYPAATRDGDGSLLLGWAGWDHREQAQALAVLITQRRGEDGWAAERITPLLAGLAEVLPWVHQWHGDLDPRYGASPADLYAGFLDGQLGELQLTAAALYDWRPAGRVDVSPLPKAGRAPAAKRTTSRTERVPVAEHVDAVLTAAATGPLSNEQIRDVTGLDAAGARAVATHLVTSGQLVTTGQKRGTRYQLP